MSDANEDPTAPDDISEALIRRIDALELPKLKSLQTYIEHRIEALRTPIEEEIRATAPGEVLSIENHGAYALVRKHPPEEDGSGVKKNITALYHVRREPHTDRSESLHWAYVGDLNDTGTGRCDKCGQTLDDGVDVCPNCGSNDIDNQEETQ